MSSSRSLSTRSQLPVVLVLVASVWLNAKTAHAQDPVATADVLFNDARAAMAVKRFDIACAKFRESNRLDPAVGTLFNLANCEAQRGQLVTAWTLYRQGLGKLPPDDSPPSVGKAP